MSVLSSFDSLYSDLEPAYSHIRLKVSDKDFFLSVNIDPLEDDIETREFATSHELALYAAFCAVVGTSLVCTYKTHIVSYFRRNDPGLCPVGLTQYALEVYSEHFANAYLDGLAERRDISAYVGDVICNRRLRELREAPRKRFISSLIHPSYLVKGASWRVFCNAMFALGFPPVHQTPVTPESPPGLSRPGLPWDDPGFRWGIKPTGYTSVASDVSSVSYSEQILPANSKPALFRDPRHGRLYSRSRIIEWVLGLMPGLE